jgi:transcriptional regulator with XRE-family HTH domain
MNQDHNRLGLIIHEYRVSNQLTAQAMASELGVSPNYLEELEQGATELVSIDFLNRVLARFKIPVQYLLESVGNRPELAFWLAVQNLLAEQVPADSLEKVYAQVMDMLNKLSEIWLHCSSVEDIMLWNNLIMRNIDDMCHFASGWRNEIPKLGAG